MSFISLDYSNLELHGLVDFIKFERDSSAACRSFDYTKHAATFILSATVCVTALGVTFFERIFVKFFSRQ